MDRCSELHVLPLSYRREVADLLFLYKCLMGTMKELFIDEIRSILPLLQNRLRSANVITLQCPLVRTETFMSSYFIRVVRMWNILPANVRDCSSFNGFKKNLLTFYFAKLPCFDVNNSCTWTSICRCTGFCHF